MLVEWNATEALCLRDCCVQDLFDLQVKRTPEAAAILVDGDVFSYVDLDRRANQLARYLRDIGIGPDEIVAICVDRSVELIVCLLGVLKAGGAYLPLDPSYPSERLEYMLKDAAARIVLTQEGLRAAIPMQAGVVVLDVERWNEISAYPKDRLTSTSIGLRPENLVYLIYTSGSTGRPKGTQMSHRSMTNLIEWHREALPTCVGKRVLQFAALSFDVAFQEAFSTLCSGGTLVLLDERVRRDVRALAEHICKWRIQRIFVPPLLLQSLSEYYATADAVPAIDLEEVITAGEQLRVSTEISSLLSRLNQCRLHNHYGPSETHVVTAYALPTSIDQWPALPPIGRPIANTQMYVLDGHGNPAPTGVIGEIYIGGMGVARGYLNRPALTAERFVADPFGPKAGARLYKTGDLGRWRADGLLEYVGRNDDQVKIRGYRIELGEIEACLLRNPGIKEAIVVAREDAPGDKRLVAYVTQKSESGISAEQLRSYLKTLLPEHMIPSAVATLDRLPLTPNGKLDRRALPPPSLEIGASRQYDAPQGEVEEVLAGIWKELLHVDQISRTDNFFELGGHSLAAMQVTVRIRSALSVEVPVRVFFDHAILKELSERIEALREESFASDLEQGGDEVISILDKVVAMSQEEVAELISKIRGVRS